MVSYSSSVSQNVLYFLLVTSNLLTDTWLSPLGLACTLLLGLRTSEFPCVREGIPFFLSHVFLSRFGEKWLLVLLYTLTRGIYKRLWFLHIITNTDHCLSSLLQLTQRNVQCTLMQMSVRLNGSSVDLSTLVTVSSCLTMYGE